MKRQFIITSIIYLFCQVLISNIGHSQQYLYSNKKNISYIINDVGYGWSITPEHNPDRLKIFFKNDDELNIIKFVSDIDSIVLQIHNHDTIRFLVILNKKDTAVTEVVGIHDLPNLITNKEKLYYLSLFWSEAKYNFMNYDNLNFNWDSLYESYIPLVLDTKNDYEYYQKLKSFAAKLNDGHTVIYNNNQFRIFFDYIPMSLVHIKNKIFIKGYRETLKDKLEIGAEIVMIEGEPTKQYMEENIFPYISASTEQFKWSIGTNNITYGLKIKPLTITYKNLNGENKTVQLFHNGESDRYDKNGNEKYKKFGHKRKYKRNLDLTFTNDSIAILNYNKFYPEKETIARFKNIVPKLLKANGLIVDIRNNRGGATDVAYSLIKRIIPNDYFLGLAAETRINDAVYKAMGYGYDKYKLYFENKMYRQETSDTIRIPDTIKRIKCPIVILIGENTFSAAEDFLLMIYEIEGRPLLLGSPTAGSTGAPLVIQGFPGGGYARICTRRCKYPYSGKPFINKGIKPDITIYPTINDILNDNDVVLKKGLELIREK